jgi:hypothetical protein
LFASLQKFANSCFAGNCFGYKIEHLYEIGAFLIVDYIHTDLDQPAINRNKHIASARVVNYFENGFEKLRSPSW